MKDDDKYSLPFVFRIVIRSSHPKPKAALINEFIPKFINAVESYNLDLIKAKKHKILDVNHIVELANQLQTHKKILDKMLLTSPTISDEEVKIHFQGVFEPTENIKI